MSLGRREGRGPIFDRHVGSQFRELRLFLRPQFPRAKIHPKGEAKCDRTVLRDLLKETVVKMGLSACDKNGMIS